MPDGDYFAILDDGAYHAASSRGADGGRVITCAVEGCGEKFTAKLMRQHAAYHILHDAGLPEMPCGLCAVHPQGQFNCDATYNCAAWLQKGSQSKSLIPKHACKVSGEVSYSHASAMKSTKTSPSTNHLIMCPQCPQKPVPSYYWKYKCMEAHWNKRHSTMTMPDELKEALKITTAEREGVKNFAMAKTRARAFKQRRVDKKAADSSAAARRRLEVAAEKWAATQEAAGTTDAL
jgi:hypothetical protein